MTTNVSPARAARVALAFSCLGHAYSHLFAPIFYVVVLALEHEFTLTHGTAVALIVVGNVLYGVAAPFAGWLGDRWSTTGMVGLFFLGTGAGMVATGLARSPFEIGLGLAITGLFASIYHPVGIAWLVRNARSWGKALGINGVFGGIGPAVATLAAGALIDLAGWRAAFIGPGLIVLATGLAFYALRMRGLIVETGEDRRPLPKSGRSDMVRAFFVLSLTMLCSGLIYQATQPALPKLFAERVGDLLQGGVLGIRPQVHPRLRHQRFRRAVGGSALRPYRWLHLALRCPRGGCSRGLRRRLLVAVGAPADRRGGGRVGGLGGTADRSPGPPRTDGRQRRCERGLLHTGPGIREDDLRRGPDRSLFWFAKNQPSSRGLGDRARALRPTPGSADLCFISAAPIERVIAHLNVCAVAILEGPVPRTGALGPMTSVYFRDPDGNLVEVASYD